MRIKRASGSYLSILLRGSLIFHFFDAGFCLTFFILSRKEDMSEL